MAAAILLAAPAVSFADDSGPRPAVKRFPIDVPEFTGISDLTIDRAGNFWSAPERKRVILQLNLTQEHPGVAGTPIPIDGIPDGLDTESIAWMEGGRGTTEFVIGTESQVNHRLSDAIFFVKVDSGRAKVTRQIALPYSLWHAEATDNEGIEGLCLSNHMLLAAGETALTNQDDKRFAPLGRYDTRTRTWTAFNLMLTSQFGRISALACRTGAGNHEIDVLAVERYIGVTHLLRFRVPLKGKGGVITPDLFADLGKLIDAVPNVEGVVWSPQDDIYLISDNDFGIVTGPTQVIVIPHGWG